MSTTSPAGTDLAAGRGAPAFSLVELLTVAAIMGMLAGVAAISLRGMRSPALASAANEVASAMKSTRQMAIASGRKHLLVIPIANNNLTTNLFRTYAIFEEVPSGETANEPPFATNGTLNSLYLAKTEWRTLPDGVIFGNLAAATYSTVAMDPYQGAILGNLFRPSASTAQAGNEWNFFESFTPSLPVCRPENLATPVATLVNVPFIGFFPNGRAYYTNPGGRQGVAVRLVQGFVKTDQIALTDTNNFYYVETDPHVGRVRVRARESYR